MAIRELAYELYKMDWMRRISCGIQMDALKDYYQETTEEDREEYTFEDYILEHGYQGQLYVCYEEFLEESRKTEEESKRLIQKINDSDKEVRDFIVENTNMSDKYIKINKENSTFSFDSNLVKVDLYNYKVVSKTYSVRVNLADSYKENK